MSLYRVFIIYLFMKYISLRVSSMCSEQCMWVAFGGEAIGP